MDNKITISEYKQFYKKIDALFNESWITNAERNVIVRLIMEKKDEIDDILNCSWIRESIMYNLGHKSLTDKLEAAFSNKIFIEASEFFWELRNFFIDNFQIEVDIYKYHENFDWERGCDKSLRPIIRKNASDPKEIIPILDKKGWDYNIEKKALHTEGFISEYWELSMASIQVSFKLLEMSVEKYIISFKWSEQEIRKVENFFNESLIFELIKEKLNLLRWYVDELTWLYNKRYINAIKAWEYSLIVIDINDFKKVNDECGHIVWDEILCWLWTILKDCIRPTDKACRMWWDEFLIFVDSNEVEVIEWIKLRIKSAVNIKNQNKPKLMKYSLSMGHESYVNNVSFEKRHAIADFNMYNSKSKSGKMHRVVSQFRDFIESSKKLDALEIILSLNKEFIKIFFSKLKSKK